MAKKIYSPDFIAAQVIKGAPRESRIKRVNLDAVIKKERANSEEFRRAYDTVRDATIVARQLNELREKRGLSQTALAELVGTSQQVISRLEQPDYTGHSLTLLRRVVSALHGQLILRIAG